MSDTRDPRTRVYRRLFQAIHAVVAVTFCILLFLGVWRGISDIRPAKPIQPSTVASCVDRAAELRGELLDRLGSIPHADSAAAEGVAFERWSVDFRARLLDARARCKKPSDASPAQAEAVGKAYAAVVRTLDLSAISATHWARHLGPSMDEASEAISAARGAD